MPMFEAAEVGQKLDKDAFEAAELEVRERLLEAQRQLRERPKRSVIVIVSGVEAAGKSEVVNRLNEWLDTRGVQSVAFWDESDEERERPRHWRFWRRLPARGTIGILFGSWYTQPIVARALKDNTPDEFEAELARIVELEQNLTDDGAVIVKLWFHLSKSAQKRRLKQIVKDQKRKLTPWEKSFSKVYDRFAKVSEAAVRATDTRHAAWRIIDSEDPRFRDITAGQVVLAGIEQACSALLAPAAASAVAPEAAATVESAPEALGAQAGATPAAAGPAAAASGAPTAAAVVAATSVLAAAAAAPAADPAVSTAQAAPAPEMPAPRSAPPLLHAALATPAERTVLDTVDLDTVLEERVYEKKLSKAQARLNALAWKAREQKRSTVVVFEGWDAAGKGGTIRRVTAAIDARLYRVIPIAAPTDEERAQHYLWRFWRHLPRAGYFTFYDRSWYGRVLVERVEGFAKPHEWARAYVEINAFEEQLARHGIVVHKFWLHISAEEQLRRFEERALIAHKMHKITEEDWRNREKWHRYVEAVQEMVGRCSTAYAPWTLVPANDKKMARVTVVKTLADRLEEALGG